MPAAAEIACTITLRGNRAQIRGQYPLEEVKLATSYMSPGYKFSKAYKLKRWDGRKHLFSIKSSSFPYGLLPAVVRALKKIDPDANIEVVDERPPAPPGEGNGFELKGCDFGGGKYAYQLECARAMIEQKRGIVKIATNGGKTNIAVAVTKHLGLPTLFLVTGIGLLHQARERFAACLGWKLEDIGIIGDGEFHIGPGPGLVTIASVDTLGERMDNPDVAALIERCAVVFSDECHHASAETVFDVLEAIEAPYRFGLSGTPLDRSDGADMRLIAQTGEVICEVTNKELIELGISVQPYVEMLRVDMPVLPRRGMNYAEVNKVGIVENEQLNRRVAERAVQAAGAGERVIIFVEKINHGKNIQLLLEDRVRVKFLNGAETTTARKQSLDDLMTGELEVIIATSIFDEGMDVPSIDVIILAGGGKAKIGSLQRIGRGLRTGKGKERLTVVDFANFCHTFLTKHSLERLETYKREDCFHISCE